MGEHRAQWRVGAALQCCFHPSRVAQPQEGTGGGREPGEGEAGAAGGTVGGRWPVRGQRGAHVTRPEAWRVVHSKARTWNGRALAGMRTRGCALTRSAAGGAVRQGSTPCPLSPHFHTDLCTEMEGKGADCCPLVGGSARGVWW